MRIVAATFVNNEVEPGWPILRADVPLGKTYRVDLDRVASVTLVNGLTGQRREVEAVWIVDAASAGFVPLMALHLQGDA